MFNHKRNWADAMMNHDSFVGLGRYINQSTNEI